jgi:hypothetical protein
VDEAPEDAAAHYSHESQEDRSQEAADSRVSSLHRAYSSAKPGRTKSNKKVLRGKDAVDPKALAAFVNERCMDDSKAPRSQPVDTRSERTPADRSSPRL